MRCENRHGGFLLIVNIVALFFFFFFWVSERLEVSRRMSSSVRKRLACGKAYLLPIGHLDLLIERGIRDGGQRTSTGKLCSYVKVRI